MGDLYTICSKIFQAWIDNGGHKPHYPLNWQGFYNIMDHIGQKNKAEQVLVELGVTGVDYK